MKSKELNYIHFDQIDPDKWDACIAKSPNALVYAQSWYLDKACDRWDALVFGDYQYVMPLTLNKKINISYLSQPSLCQQLGIFPTPTKEIIKQFFDEAQQFFPFAEINLNGMILPIRNVNGTFIPKKNYLLSLDLPYTEIHKQYSKHTKRKVKKARKNKLNLIKAISVEEYLHFKKQNQKDKTSESSYTKLRNIFTFGLSKSMGQIYGVYSPLNELCAAVFFLRFKNRVTYLNAATNPEGRKLSAMYLLIDQFIQEHAESEYFIDFEGSMIPGVARLYQGFGASPEIYHHYRWNKLPFWLRWLKKR